jgi:sodium pump decarboxylase gamma subunit
MELLTQALTIMGVGMTLVFLFLLVVIGGIVATARLIRRHEARPPGARAGAAPEPQRLAAVIAVALAEHETNGG